MRDQPCQGLIARARRVGPLSAAGPQHVEQLTVARSGVLPGRRHLAVAVRRVGVLPGLRREGLRGLLVVGLLLRRQVPCMGRREETGPVVGRVHRPGRSPVGPCRRRLLVGGQGLGGGHGEPRGDGPRAMRLAPGVPLCQSRGQAQFCEAMFDELAQGAGTAVLDDVRVQVRAADPDLRLAGLLGDPAALGQDRVFEGLHPLQRRTRLLGHALRGVTGSDAGLDLPRRERRGGFGRGGGGRLGAGAGGCRLGRRARSALLAVLASGAVICGGRRARRRRRLRDALDGRGRAVGALLLLRTPGFGGTGVFELSE